MSDPIPPSEWSSRIQERNADYDPVFPPRPEVVQVTDIDSVQGAANATEHAGHRPINAPVNPAPQLLSPEQQRPARWRRPPGQQDNKGEPTSASTELN